MGYRICLIAIQGKDASTIQDLCELRETGEREEVPESPVVGSMLPSGYYVLYINDTIIPNDRVLARMSQGASLIILQVNETVMVSQAGAWVDGIGSWFVLHDSELGLQHLDSTGDLPAAFESIRDRLIAEAKQDDGTVDDYGPADHVFDVPVELFASIVGYRYDSDLGGIVWRRLARR